MKRPMDQQGVVYKVKCGDCENFYIGETGRKLRTRLREHEKDASSDKKEECISGLSKHAMESKHNIIYDSAEILHKERNFQKRKLKEAIAIKKQSMSLLNKKEEIKTLSNIWENILQVSLRNYFNYLKKYQLLIIVIVDIYRE